MILASSLPALFCASVIFVSPKSAAFKFLCKLFLGVYSYLNSWIVALCPTLYQHRVSNMEPMCHRDHLLNYGWLQQNLFWDDTPSGKPILSVNLTGGRKQPLPSVYMRQEQSHGEKKPDSLAWQNSDEKSNWTLKSKQSMHLHTRCSACYRAMHTSIALYSCERNMLP